MVCMGKKIQLRPLSADDSVGGATGRKSDRLVVNVLQSPRAKKGAKKRSKQSKIEISGKKKKKFILTLPEESSSSDASNGKKS